MMGRSVARLRRRPAIVRASGNRNRDDSRASQTIGLGPLYSLLQITDSLFPSGSFAHSYGLETLFEGDRQRPREDLFRAMMSIWRGHLLRTEGLLGLHSHRAFVRGDLDRLAGFDRALSAAKLARELREPSVATGRGFLSVARTVVD